MNIHELPGPIGATGGRCVPTLKYTDSYRKTGEAVFKIKCHNGVMETGLTE